MHIKKAEERRNNSDRPPPFAQKKKDQGKWKKIFSIPFNAFKRSFKSFKFLFGWFFSTRGAGSFCFIFGMIGRFFRIFDEIIQDYKGAYPSYLACPGIVFITTILCLCFVTIDDSHSLPQVFAMVTCTGVLAGAIIEEQLEEANRTDVTTEEMAYLSLACATLSFLVCTLDYSWKVSMKMLFLRFIVIVMPVWTIVLSTLQPLSPVLLIEVVNFSLFTLAIGIIECFMTDLRSHVPIFTSVFPARYIGCLVQSFGMVVLSTYYTSWRNDNFSGSWFSFAWVIYAGGPISVFTVVCHLIYWTSEKIFGDGSHNKSYVIRAVLFAWIIVYALNSFGLFGRGFWSSSTDIVRSILKYLL